MATDLYVHPDYLFMDELLTEEQKLVRDAARAWVKKEVSPIIEEYYEKAEFPKQVLKGLGEIGAFGPYIPEQYGGPGFDQITYGLLMQELERCDSGLRSTASVQSSLVMYPIYKFGNEEQRMKYLPKLATGEMIGCFGLTSICAIKIRDPTGRICFSETVEVTLLDFSSSSILFKSALMPNPNAFFLLFACVAILFIQFG